MHYRQPITAYKIPPFGERAKPIHVHSHETTLIFQGLVMAEFVTVARVGEIPEGEGMSYVVEDTIVAVFNDGGEYHAINDLCPHMGASLAGGIVEDGAVACPWHAWRFRVSDGTWCDNPRIKTDSYELRVFDGEIQVRLPDKQQPEPDS